MLPESSTHTATCACLASSESRLSLAAPTTSLATSTSATPPATSASASLTFWQHTPTAPSAICRSAISGHLWLLACGRKRMFLPESDSGRRFRLRSNASSSRIRHGVSTSASGMPMAAAGRKVMWYPSVQRVIVIDRQRRVVGEALVLVDFHFARTRRDAGSRDLVIDAPADVLGPRLAAVRPPGVLLGARVDAAEHVNPAEVIEHPRQPLPLCGQKARVFAVAAPVPEIDLLVRDVPVAA